MTQTTAEDRLRYRSSIGKVRTVLERAGGAAGVTRGDLDACRADLLVVERTALAAKHDDSPIARLFELSPDVEALIRRIVIDDHPGDADGPAHPPRTPARPPAGTEQPRR